MVDFASYLSHGKATTKWFKARVDASTDTKLRIFFLDRAQQHQLKRLKTFAHFKNFGVFDHTMDFSQFPPIAEPAGILRQGVPKGDGEYGGSSRKMATSFFWVAISRFVT